MPTSERPAAVVFGATGNQGSNVVRHLYAAGWADIFCVTRNPEDPRSQQVQRHATGLVESTHGMPYAASSMRPFPMRDFSA